MPGLKSILLIGSFVFIGGCAVPVIKQDGKVLGLYTPRSAWLTEALRRVEDPEERKKLLGYGSAACTAIGLLTGGSCPAAAAIASRIADARVYVADYRGARDETYETYRALANTFPSAASKDELTDAVELANRLAVEDAAQS